MDTCSLETVKNNWNTPGLNNPDLIIIQPRLGGVGCELLIEQLAKASYRCSKTNRSFKQSYLALRYPNIVDTQLMNKFFDSPRIVANHYNRFEGVFAVDISEWIGDFHSAGFLKLLDYTRTNHYGVKYIFIINSSPDFKAAECAYKRISQATRLQALFLEYPSADEFTRHAVEILNLRGIKTDNDAVEAMQACISQIYKKQSFAGSDSIARLVEDVIFEVQTGNADEPKLTQATFKVIENKIITGFVNNAYEHSMGFSQEK